MMETVILWFWSPYATASKSLSLKPEAEKIPHLRMDLPAQHFQMSWCSTTSNNWSTSCLMTWALPKKIAPGILPWWHSLNWRHWRTCELGRSNPKTGEENAGEDWMKNIKKNVKTQELNVVKGMTVFRLCGETHLKMLVNRDLVRPVVSEAEILQRGFHSRLRRLWEHQLHHRKLHQHLRQRHVTRLHQHQLPLQMSHHRSKRLQFDRAARSPSNAPLVPSRTVGTSANTPPWRLRERGRERSQTPVERNTRIRTDSRSDWSNRSRPYNIPEPPAPPSRMMGSQWLDQGHQGTSSSSTGYRDSGYSYHQPSYYRTNPQSSSVEYVPGYTVPRQRWIQKYNGEWLDMIPQYSTDTRSVNLFPSGRRIAKKKWNGFLWIHILLCDCRSFRCKCAAFAACLPVVACSFDFVFGHVSQQITSWALLVKSSCMFRHEENLCLFVIYFVLRVYTMLSCMLTCTQNSLCTLRHFVGSRLLQSRVEKKSAAATSWPQVFKQFPGLP